MISNFKTKDSENIWNGTFSKKFPPSIQNIARRKLRMINNATILDDLKSPPGNKLEELKGDRKGQYSIRINDQFRICFLWTEGIASEVEIVDYH